MKENKDNVYYLCPKDKDKKPLVLKFEDIPSAARKSFHKSLENAVFSQIAIKKAWDKEDFADDEFISNVLIHMKNKAKYDPVWAKYIFDVLDEIFVEMIMQKIEGLMKRTVSEYSMSMYKSTVKTLKDDSWLPVPENYFEFTYKYDLLMKAAQKKMLSPNLDI